MLSNVKQNREYRVDLNAGELPVDGIVEIKRALRREGYPVDFPDDWSWQKKLTCKGEFQGGLIKRIGKLHYQQTGKRLPTPLMGELGSIISRYTPEKDEYRFDITQTFDWDAGDYGDDGSCFWTYNAHSRRYLEEGGAYAIRLYDADGDGYARAWLIDCQDYVAIFNAYGEDRAVIANVLAKWLGERENVIMTYSRTSIENYYPGIDTNCDGMIIGTSENIEGVNYVEMDIETSYHYCDDCGDGHDIEELTSIQDQRICENCIGSYALCSDCDEYHSSDEGIEYDGDYICPSCANDYTLCDDCENYHRNCDVTPLDNLDKVICDDCLENYIECPHCGEYRQRTPYDVEEPTPCCDCASGCESWEKKGFSLRQYSLFF